MSPSPSAMPSSTVGDHGRFLTTPGASHLGRAPGDITLRLAFAGATYRFVGLNELERDGVLERFDKLVVDPAPAADDVVTTLAHAGSALFHPIPTTDWEYRLAISHDVSHVTLSGIGFWAEIVRAPLGAELAVDEADAHFQGAFENLFRVLVAYQLLMREGAFVMHSAGIADGDDGFLFFGRSGAGKTTLSGLSKDRGLRVLSDELNALRPRDDGTIELLPMPFAGDFGQDNISLEPCTLRGLYALEQGDAPASRPCSRPQAISRITASCPFTNVDPSLDEPLFTQVGALVQRMPVRILTFALDGSFWDVVRRDTGM